MSNCYWRQSYDTNNQAITHSLLIGFSCNRTDYLEIYDTAIINLEGPSEQSLG